MADTANSTRTPSSGATTALTVADLNTEVNCEPRVLDTTLGAHLGMAQPLNIRATIEAMTEELAGYGEVFTSRVKTSARGGRPSKAFYLNEGQALCICALSRAPNAPQVRRALIDAFMELRRRQVKALVSSENTCDLAASDNAGLPQVAAPPKPRLVDLFAWSCMTLTKWQEHGIVTDPDAALRVIHRAMLDVVGDDFVGPTSGRRRRG